MWGSSYGDCTTVVNSPSNGILNGVVIGESVEISCRCGRQSGTWYFNGSQIGAYVDLDIPTFLPQHAGNYTCASNNSREKSTVIELKIPKHCKQ